MPDLFGKKQLGRATTGGRFYATPTERVETGAVYFPDESSLFFGVAEYTVEAGNLGAFATEGTFVFERPDDWFDSLGRKVFYRPSTGEIVNQDKKGDVLIGFQVFANVPDDKLGVVLTQGENSVVIMVTSTADSGAGSLRQAIADAHDGDVILFDADVFPAGQTTSILLSSYIGVNKSVSIYGGASDGAGGYTSGATKRFYVYRDVEGVKTKVYIDDENPALDGETVLFENLCRVALDGQEATRSLYAGASADYQISGICFANSVSNAGAIYLTSTSSGRLIDCFFVDDTSTSNGGGAYLAVNATAQFDACAYINCNGIYGGAIFTATNTKVTLNGCSFDNNNAGSIGGAIYSANDSQNALNGCTISGCTAPSGGAIGAGNASIDILNDCTISDCSASNGGGVYTSSASQNTLNDCTITGCSATSNGGGIYSNNTSQNTLNDCNITGCSSNEGGGIYTRSSSQCELNNSSVVNCTASNRGPGVYTGDTSTLTINALHADDLWLANAAFLNVAGGVSIVKNGDLNSTTVTIADGAALTITTSASIGAATFTSEGRGYLAVAAGIDTSAATLTNVVLCSYGAGLESFEISEDGATWTAQDLTTPILLEKKGDGDVWTTLSDDATGGSYSDTFAIGTTLRAFDGVRFLVASLDAYWQVEPFVVASNGGGGAGDDSPSWTISDATITPNAEEV